jgi:hypothetical protein
MNEHFSNPFLQRIARQDFERAVRRGFWHSILSFLRNNDNRLLSFDELRQKIPLRHQHDIGLKQVPIDHIIGSVGRYRDFDRVFLPRQKHTRRRWENIDILNIKEASIPPVDLYKVGSAYFVRDGNHRVSVARERGQAYLDAMVTEVEVSVPVDEDTEIDDLIRLAEKAEFLEKTRLGEICPDAKITFTLPGGYSKLVEHVEVHRYFLTISRQQEIPWDVAVEGWYHDVYSPLVQVLREKRVLDDFPGRTEADLYLWVIEHLWYLRQGEDREVGLIEGVDHFVREYMRQPLHRLVAAVMRFLRWLGNA